MAIRKIKDAKDLSTSELIYFKSHAQATYMSDGRTVEEAITSSTGGLSTTSMEFVIPTTNISIPMNNYKVVTMVTSTNQTFTLNTNSVVTNISKLTQEQKWEILFGIDASLSTAPTITFNTGGVATIYWINGVAPTFEVGKFYEVSFLNAGGILLGVCAEFSAS